MMEPTVHFARSEEGTFFAWTGACPVCRTAMTERDFVPRGRALRGSGWQCPKCFEVVGLIVCGDCDNNCACVPRERLIDQVSFSAERGPR